MTRAQSLETTCNVASFLPRLAAERGEQPGLICRQAGAWETIAYAELDARCDRIAHGFQSAGLRRGDRCLVLARPDARWIAAVYALFKLGAIPVLIDPGMGRKNLLACVERIEPRGFLGIPLAHALRAVFRRPFRTVEVPVVTGGRGPFRAPHIDEWLAQDRGRFEPVHTQAEDEAAILFTSGSTGPAKGVRYDHGIFSAQVRMLRTLYGFRPGASDLACFPLFALFHAALGVTTVLPEMDFARPGRCDPARIVDALRTFRVETTFGSPAIWRRVLPWCEKNSVQLEHLRALMIAGAPVEPALLEIGRRVLGENGDVHTPYGATEALPVADIGARSVLDEFRARVERGEGTCVGKPVPEAEVRVIEIRDEPIETWDSELEVPRGSMGEICVRGPQVTREYKYEEKATRAAKIRDGNTLWHRMGDLGRLDRDGNLWFFGRKSHRIETAAGTQPPVPLENVFRTHPRVARCAVVGLGARGCETPVLIVDASAGDVPTDAAGRDQLAEELIALAADVPARAAVERVLFKRGFPLDVRHNAKINRLELKSWAEHNAR